MKTFDKTNFIHSTLMMKEQSHTWFVFFSARFSFKEKFIFLVEINI